MRVKRGFGSDKNSKSVGAAQAPVPATITGSEANTKKENKMSTVQPTENSNVEKIEKTYKGFDLETLKSISVKKEVEFTPATSYQDAVQRLGSDQKILLKALNDALRAQTLTAARKEALGSNGGSRKAVLDFIKPYRMSPKFAAMVTKERGTDGWKDEYAKQTDSILQEVSQVPFIMENLKAVAAAAVDDDDTDGE
jgi:hypothetical protein